MQRYSSVLAPTKRKQHVLLRLGDQVNRTGTRRRAHHDHLLLREGELVVPVGDEEPQRANPLISCKGSSQSFIRAENRKKRAQQANTHMRSPSHLQTW